MNQQSNWNIISVLRRLFGQLFRNFLSLYLYVSYSVSTRPIHCIYTYDTVYLPVRYTVSTHKIQCYYSSYTLYLPVRYIVSTHMIQCYYSSNTVYEPVRYSPINLRLKHGWQALHCYISANVLIPEFSSLLQRELKNIVAGLNKKPSAKYTV